MYEKYAKIRDSLNLSDYAVAKGSGVGRSTLSDWKSGSHTPNTTNMKKIANFLKVPVDSLVGNTEVVEKESESIKMYYFDDDTAEKAQEIFEKPGLRSLFDVAKDSRPEYVQMAEDLLRKLKETNPDG